MNLFNKSIAGFTAIALVASTLVSIPFSVKANSEENMAAYEWAYENMLTTKSTFTAFMFDGTLTREAFARFAVEGANTLGFEMTSDQECNFSDMNAVDPTLAQFPVEGCMMGLFAANAQFSPKATVTRSMIEVVVARMVVGFDEVRAYADQNGITEFEAAHEILMDAEIVTKDVAPASSAVRGHVILMLYRMAGMLEPVTCLEDPTMPGCLPGTTGTVNTGTVVVVKAGSLDVSLNAASSPANLSSIPMQGIVKFATVNFSAGSSDVSLNEVSLKRSGLGNNVDVSKVYFEKDGIRVSGRSSVASDGVVVLNFNPAFVVKAGMTESIDLYAELVGTLAGSEHKFSSTSIVSSALTTNGSIETPTLRTANYTVASVGFASAGAGGSSTADQATDLELGQFRLTNNGNGTSETRDVLLKGVTLRNDGTADVQDSVKSIGLYRNGQKVNTTAIINGKEVTFGLAGDEIKDSQSATYYIRGNVDYVDGVNGDTYKFALKRNSDLNTIEKTTSFRTSVTPTTAVSLATYTVNGADLVFKKDSTFVLTKTVSPGATSVLFMKGTLTAKTAVDLEDVSLTFASSTGANLIAKRYTLKIGTSTFTWTAGSGVAGNAAFDGAVSFGGTVPVELYADIDVNAPASNITFGSLNLNSFVTTKEYQNTQNTIASSIGSINSASVYVESTKLSVSKTDGLASLVTLVKDTQDEKLVYGVTLSNNQTNAINVSNLVVNNTSAGFNSGMSLTLYVNDVATSTKTVAAQMVTFNSMNVNVVNGTPISLKVKATINGVATGTQGQFYISSIDATDTVSSAAALFSGLPATGSMIRVVDAGSSTVTLNSATPAATLLYGGMSSTEAGRFDIEARNDSMKLTDLYVSVTPGFNLDKLATVSLTDDTTTYPGIKDGNTIKFESMNFAIAANATKTLKIKVALSNVEFTGDLANPNFQFTINTGYGFAKAGTTNGLRLTSDSNGLPVTNVTTPSIISNTHTVVAGYPFLSNPTSSAASPTTVMQFTVTPMGTKVRMSSLTFTSAGSAFTGNVQLTDSNNIVISTGTVAGGVLTFTGTAAVVTSATTFKVIAPNYSATQNDSTRSFTITDISYDQWTSADGIYTNVPSVTSFMSAVGLNSSTLATFSTFLAN